MNEIGPLAVAPVLQGLTVATQLLLAGAFLVVLWEVMILLASLISLQPPRST
jgi:uncharacterized membrane protein YvlD (DUF360 family)